MMRGLFQTVMCKCEASGSVLVEDGEQKFGDLVTAGSLECLIKVVLFCSSVVVREMTD